MGLEIRFGVGRRLMKRMKGRKGRRGFLGRFGGLFERGADG